MLALKLEIGSVWATEGKLQTTNVAAQVLIQHVLTFQQHQKIICTSNLITLFIKYQMLLLIGATVDAGIEEIATTTWAGFGTTLKELTGTPRNRAISVFGGVLTTMVQL